MGERLLCSCTRARIGKTGADLYVGDLPNHEVIVSMLVSSRSPQVVEIAKTIFSTIDFPIP